MLALSMAASTVSSSPLFSNIAFASTLSSSLHSNLTFSPSPLSLSALFAPKPLKFFKLNYHFPNPLFPNFSSDFHLACTEFESSEAAQDDSLTSEDELQSETEEEHAQEAEEEEEVEEKPTESNGQGRLYVGNLPYSMTSSQLTEVFQEAGPVANVEVIYDRVTDRSRGFGFVTMASVEEAKEAIQMFNGSQIGGRTVRVNFPEVPKGGEREVLGTRIVDSPHKIYAGNLGWSLASQGLRDAFGDQPGLLSSKVIYERDTGRSRGFGFVSFESAETAEAAINSMNGVEVEGRPLRLNLAAERARPAPYQRPNVEDNVESTELFSGIGS